MSLVIRQSDYFWADLLGHLIFYRFNNETLFAEGVIHGARDLPWRLLQPPYEG